MDAIRNAVPNENTGRCIVCEIIVTNTFGNAIDTLLPTLWRTNFPPVMSNGYAEHYVNKNLPDILL